VGRAKPGEASHPFDETSAFFHDQETLERVRGLQVSYFLRLTRGSYDLAYAEDRLKIGATHERIGLALQFYLGSYNVYLREVSNRLMDAFPEDHEQGRQAFLSLMKLVFLDIGLAIDTYVFQRTQQLLRSLREKRARVVVLDITGVPSVDSNVANHLVRAVDGATEEILGYGFDGYVPKPIDVATSSSGRSRRSYPPR